MRVGDRHCHGELTGLSQALRHADVVPEDGFTMSDDGTHCRVRAILTREEGREENPSKSTRPGAIQTSGSRATPMGTCGLASGRVGSNKLFFCVGTDSVRACSLFSV